MLKWLIVTALALVIFSGLQPMLRKIGLGRLPGDFSWRVRGREIQVPLMSTILLSSLAMGLTKLL
jgi:uncharacterized membrane protein